MISNSTAIAEVFSRIDHKFDLMYANGVARKTARGALLLRLLRQWIRAEIWLRDLRDFQIGGNVPLAQVLPGGHGYLRGGERQALHQGGDGGGLHQEHGLRVQRQLDLDFLDRSECMTLLDAASTTLLAQQCAFHRVLAMPSERIVARAPFLDSNFADAPLDSVYRKIDRVCYLSLHLF